MTLPLEHQSYRGDEEFLSQVEGLKDRPRETDQQKADVERIVRTVLLESASALLAKERFDLLKKLFQAVREIEFPRHNRYGEKILIELLNYAWISLSERSRLWKDLKAEYMLLGEKRFGHEILECCKEIDRLNQKR